LMKLLRGSPRLRELMNDEEFCETVRKGLAGMAGRCDDAEREELLESGRLDAKWPGGGVTPGVLPSFLVCADAAGSLSRVGIHRGIIWPFNRWSGEQILGRIPGTRSCLFAKSCQSVLCPGLEPDPEKQKLIWIRGTWTSPTSSMMQPRLVRVCLAIRSPSSEKLPNPKDLQAARK